MDPDAKVPLLGGLTPTQFMRRHWQKKPLLVRQALPGIGPPLDRRDLFALAGEDAVESRLITHGDGGWRLRRGPLPRRALPPLARPRWTLLVQGLDLHVQAAHELLARFRFVPDARLDDLMLSYATDGGGVGPHLDSYDVFLIQVLGQRRWRIGPARDTRLVDGLPLRILRNFEADREWVLEPGDLLYLPPRWAHEGTAVGECMTASVGYRASPPSEVARELLARLADDLEADPAERPYADPRQGATDTPALIPPSLGEFARAALLGALANAASIGRALGEWLTETKPQVWFGRGAMPRKPRSLQLDRRTRMMYDMRHVYINGESFRVGGRDAHLMRRLADARRLTAAEVAGASAASRAALTEWARSGWLHAEGDRGR